VPRIDWAVTQFGRALPATGAVTMLKPKGAQP
jgi:hypothetical protein